MKEGICRKTKTVDHSYGESIAVHCLISYTCVHASVM